MTTYAVTKANWNDPAFWSSVRESGSGYMFDFSTLPADFTVEFDKATGRIVISDRSTRFAVRKAGCGGAPDAMLDGGTRWYFFETSSFGSGSDPVRGNAAAQTVDTGRGNDTVDGGEGDTLITDSGDPSSDDTLCGEAGHDTIDGGIHEGLIDGGAGTILGGSGDAAEGGDGDDHVRRAGPGAPGSGAIGIARGETEAAGGDTLQLPPDISRDSIALDDTHADDDAGDDATGPSGRFTMSDDTAVACSEIENIICFTPGTMILTSHGDRPVETLKVGDMVVTRDQGLRPVRWIGSRTVTGMGQFAPVRVGAKALDHARNALLVSPQHRILYTGYRAELLFGEAEVLMPAKHLIDGRDVMQEPCREVTYIHMMFDHHEVIYAEGIATESFHAGDLGLGGVGEASREELFMLFPELRTAPGRHIETARLCLRQHESALLMDDAHADACYW